MTTNEKDVNKTRHDPSRTEKIIDNDVEPKIDKNTDGIGGKRDPINPLEDEGELTSAALQKTLLDADIDGKDNESPVKEEEPDTEKKSTTLQTFIFDKDKFTQDQAKEWLKKEKKKDSDIKIPAADETEDSYRFRQKEPEDFKNKSFKTIPITTGVKGVIGKKENTKSNNPFAPNETYGRPQRESTSMFNPRTPQIRKKGNATVVSFGRSGFGTTRS